MFIDRSRRETSFSTDEFYTMVELCKLDDHALLNANFDLLLSECCNLKADVTAAMYSLYTWSLTQNEMNSRQLSHTTSKIMQIVNGSAWSQEQSLFALQIYR